MQFLEAVWAGQSLAVSDSETDSYNLQVTVNDIPFGSYTIAPGQKETLWEAPDPISSNTFHVTATNSRTGDVFTVDTNSLCTYIPSQAGLSDIPLNAKLSDYKILTTNTCYSQSYYIIDPESHTACDPIVTYSGSSQQANLRAEVGVTQGPGADLGGDIFVGCHAFIGYKAECSASCGLSGGMQLGFKLGIAFPIQPFVEHGCGWGCKVSFADAGCEASASASAQAGYEAKVGAGLKYTYHCPVEATVYDSLGRQAGYCSDSNDTNLLLFIPDANYTGPEAEPQSIYVPAPLPGNYKVILVGTDNGTCTASVQSYDSKGSIIDTDEWQNTVVMGEQCAQDLALDPSGIINLPHNIKVTSVDSKTVVGQGYPMSIEITAANRGNWTESFNLTAYVNGDLVMSFVNVTLNSRNSTTLICAWNTTGVAYGNCTITTCVEPIPNETDISDDNLTSWVMVSLPGDITGPNGRPDGLVDMMEVGYVASRFLTEPGKPLWDPNADINGDGIVDMQDIGIAASHFGDHYP